MPVIPSPPLIATVLPPGEGFGPARTGAIGLIVHRLTRVEPALVVGGPQAGPAFDDVAFRAATPVRWRPGSTNARYAAAVARLLAPLRPALIEVHNRPEVALILAARLPDAKTALFLHNDPQAMRRAATPAERGRLLARLARVVTVSEFLRARLLEGVAAPAQVPAVLANPIDLTALPAPVPRERLILFAGRVVADKGADAFVAACADALPHLPGWRAELIGADRFRADAPETRYVAAVRTAADAAGVQMHGYIDHPQVLAALTRAAIAVVPSRWEEPFGLAALEALACGAALVCAPRGGLSEVAGDAAIYAAPEHPGEIAAALVALALDPARRAALADAGQARARRFALAVIAPQLAALRRELLASGGPSPAPPLYSSANDASQAAREPR